MNMPMLMFTVDKTDVMTITDSTVEGGMQVLSFGELSIRIPESHVAKLRDALLSFRTEEESKVEAKAYGESV